VRGWREASPADFDRVLGAFTKLTGVRPTDFWELVLQRAVQEAIVFRDAIARLPGSLHTPEGQPVAIPEAPGAAEILELVREFSPPGTLPSFIDELAIAAALERCTDGRGGGRGRLQTKWSVRKWIRWFKAEVKKRSRRNSRV
jgi:hypothetical protein